MPTRVKGDYTNIVVQQEVDQRPWWEKYESNAEKRTREQNAAVSFTADDLKFLKEFGGTTISLAGIFFVSKMLKR